MIETLKVHADLGALRLIGPWMRRLLEQSGELEPSLLAPKMELAIQEICVNIVSYAYDQQDDPRIVLTWLAEESHYSFTISDCGTPYDPESRLEVDFDHPTIGGYGLFLVESLCEELHYVRVDGENHWTLTFAVPLRSQSESADTSNR